MKTATLLILIGLLVLVGVQPAVADDDIPNWFTYTVRSGDTPELIAAKFGTTVEVIVQANLDVEDFEPGTKITIPAFEPTYEPVSGSKSWGSSGSWQGVYIVRWGDSLSGIAWRFGVNTWALAKANGIGNPNYIYAGQRLVVPGSGYWPGKSDGGWQGKHGGFYYTVCWGDTLSSIAWRYGVSPWAIAQANRLHNPNRIYAGQTLYIP